MTRRRDLLRAAVGAGIAGLAGCPGQASDEGAEETATEAGTPPAIEGEAPRWTTGAKYGVATVPDHASDDPSKVWATFTQGAVTEVRHPRIDLLNLRTLEFVVVGEGEVWRTYETDRTADDGVERSTTLATDDALVYEQTATPADGDAWELTVEWVTDPARDALLGDVAFAADGDYDLYAVARTACSQSAGADVGQRTEADGGYELAAWDGPENDSQHVVTDADGDTYEVALGMVAAGGFDRASALSNDDGQALLDAGRWTDSAAAEDVVTLAGRLLTGSGETQVAAGFAADRDGEAARETARDALSDGYDRARAAYVQSWRDYLAEIDVPDSVAGDDALATQYRVAAMVLTAVEDKTFLGAGIASPSVPWGSAIGASTPSDYGYNFVWTRDLYQSFTAFRAMGDVEAAQRALEYVFEYQQRDGGFIPQNTFLDGRTRWGGEQLDEIAFPLVMAAQLADRHGITVDDAAYDYEQLRASAEYVVNSGPSTGQERWEEESGYSPSTIAAEVAGLTAAASLAADAGERMDALVWLAIADDWARRVDEWCATTTGTDGHTETPYYVRVTNGDPDSGQSVDIANGGPTLDQRAVVDAGFLELVRLGIVPADDEVVRNSVAEVDDTLRVETPNGPAWYRYNGDGYGEPTDGSPWSGSGQGRLWPIFTGERAEYELRRGTESGDLAPEALLETMANFANEGRMIPEQVWDSEEPTAYGWAFGEGTGSATPLSWSMAQFVRLAHSIDAGEPVETPPVVAERFGEARRQPSLSVTDLPTRTESATLTVEAETDAREVLVRAGEQTARTTVEDGTATLDIELTSIRTNVTVVAVDQPGDLLDAAVALDRQAVTYTGG